MNITRQTDIQISARELREWNIPKIQALISNPSGARQMASLITKMLEKGGLSSADRQALNRRRREAILVADKLMIEHGGGYYPHHLFRRTAENREAFKEKLRDLRQRSEALGSNTTALPVISEEADIIATISLFDFLARITAPLGDMLRTKTPLEARRISGFLVQIDSRKALTEDGEEQITPIVVVRGKLHDLQEYVSLKKDDNAWRTLRKWATDATACPWRLCPVPDPCTPNGPLVYLPFVEFRVSDAPQRDGKILAERARSFRLEVTLALVANNKATSALSEDEQKSVKSVTGGRDLWAPGNIRSLINKWHEQKALVWENTPEQEKRNAERARIYMSAMAARPADLDHAFRRIWESNTVQAHIDAMLQNGHQKGEKLLTIEDLTGIGAMKKYKDRTKANVRAGVLFSMMKDGIFRDEYVPHYKGRGGKVSVKIDPSIQHYDKKWGEKTIRQVEGILFQWEATASEFPSNTTLE